MWCQLVTHMLRARESTIVVIDEPDTYLHPDLQRRLLRLLRNLGPDVLIATHSSELVAEAEPHEVLLIYRRAKQARRIASAQELGRHTGS